MGVGVYKFCSDGQVTPRASQVTVVREQEVLTRFQEVKRKSGGGGGPPQKSLNSGLSNHKQLHRRANQ